MRTVESDAGGPENQVINVLGPKKVRWCTQTLSPRYNT